MAGYRKYTLNENYFDSIDTPEQAYWLGFFTADGCVMGTPYNTIRLSLKKSDKDHVQLFRDTLGSNNLLQYRESDTGNTVGVGWGSVYMVKSLERLGVTPRKSLTAEPWSGPEGLMPHYWRGLFDGDGTIFRTYPKARPGCEEWWTGICGSQSCVEAFAEWGRSVTGSKAKIGLSTKRSPDCWSWKLGGGPKPQLLAKALYKDASVALERKRVLAETLISIDFDQVRIKANAARGLKVRTIGSRTGSTSRYKGVSWCQTRKKWQAQIFANGKSFKLGRYTSENEAARAYNRKALELFGPDAYLNPVT
jgi:hypothetical protein